MADDVAVLGDAVVNLEVEDPEELARIVNQVTPFGRFQGRRLIELPEPYLVWFHNQGFPNGK